jgi:23S rRNA pseudouridine2605 synthase
LYRRDADAPHSAGINYNTAMPTQRIQKILAAAGYGSRRACERLVTDGRVTVNGRRAVELPLLVDAKTDRITVDGRPVRGESLVYYLLNKPGGVFCTHSDPAGRKRAVDLMVGVRERLFCVGRLDADATGLLIMTNDGALSQKLAHPRFAAPQTYRAEVSGCPTPQTLDRLRKGIWLSEGRTAPALLKIVHRQRTKAILEVTLREGRHREIRRMLARTGHNVRRLVRIRMGKLSISKLALGAYRRLAPNEVAYLHSLVDAAAAPVRREGPATAARRPPATRRGSADAMSGRPRSRGGEAPRSPARAARQTRRRSGNVNGPSGTQAAPGKANRPPRRGRRRIVTDG